MTLLPEFVPGFIVPGEGENIGKFALKSDTRVGIGSCFPKSQNRDVEPPGTRVGRSRFVTGIVYEPGIITSGITAFTRECD
jgi:hypothetical protein